MKLPIRQCFLALFLGALGLLGAALFFQYYQNLNPCPLCIMQRISLIWIALTCLLAIVHNPGNLGYRIWACCVTFGGLAGLGFAARQLYLQSLPAGSAPACMPPLGYLMDTLPASQWIPILFRGTGDCATVQWQWLGLSMPVYTAIIFTLLTLCGTLMAWYTGKRLFFAQKP